MNIVVLDGYTLNPGDLSWKPLELLGSLEVYDRTLPEHTLSRCQNADVVLTNKTVLDSEIITKLTRVKYIGVLATGFNVVDVSSAQLKGITVTNIPAYGSSSVAQHTFALLLELTNRVKLHANSVEKGKWAEISDFSYSLSPLTGLEGKTLGIIGYGNIGKHTAKIAQAFGMNVLIHSQSNQRTEVGRLVTLNELLESSDVVSLHCALHDKNAQMVNKDFLSRMKPTAFLINTSRGPLINEHDLVEALQKGEIAGAGLDVLSEEPPRSGNPLIGVKNCIITPHIAWATREARQTLMDIAVKNIQSFISGFPINVIS